MEPELLIDKIQHVLDAHQFLREYPSYTQQDVAVFEAVLQALQEHCPERFVTMLGVTNGN